MIYFNNNKLLNLIKHSILIINSLLLIKIIISILLLQMICYILPNNIILIQNDY